MKESYAKGLANHNLRSKTPDVRDLLAEYRHEDNYTDEQVAENFGRRIRPACELLRSKTPHVRYSSPQIRKDVWRGNA